MKINLRFVLCLVVVPSLLFAQSNKKAIETQLQTQLDNVRKGSPLTEEISFDSSDEKYFLRFLRTYDNDSSPRVKEIVNFIKQTLAFKSRDLSIRQAVVEDGIKFILSESSGKNDDFKMLDKAFKNEDFSERARQILVASFPETSIYGAYLMLCGRLQLKELLPKVQQMAKDFKRYNKESEAVWWRSIDWYAALTAARMGDSSYNDKMIAGVELTVNPYERVSILLPELAYTRQTDCFRLLQKYLESDDSLAKGNIDNDYFYNTHYSIIALNLLAQYWNKGFPVRYKEHGGYTDEELISARTFMKNWGKNISYAQ